LFDLSLPEPVAFDGQTLTIPDVRLLISPEFANIAVLSCVKYRPNPQPLPYKGRGVKFKASLLLGESFGERLKCIASKREALYTRRL
jgi:hypothetical protein